MKTYNPDDWRGYYIHLCQSWAETRYWDKENYLKLAQKIQDCEVDELESWYKLVDSFEEDFNGSEVDYDYEE